MNNSLLLIKDRLYILQVNKMNRRVDNLWKKLDPKQHYILNRWPPNFHIEVGQQNRQIQEFKKQFESFSTYEQMNF